MDYASKLPKHETVDNCKNTEQSWSIQEGMDNLSFAWIGAIIFKISWSINESPPVIGLKEDVLLGDSHRVNAVR